MPPIPKRKQIHVILSKDGGYIYEELQNAGVEMGLPEYRGHPYIFYNCFVEPDSPGHELLRTYMAQGDLIYAYD